MRRVLRGHHWHVTVFDHGRCYNCYDMMYSNMIHPNLSQNFSAHADMHHLTGRTNDAESMVRNASFSSEEAVSANEVSESTHSDGQ